MPSLATTIRTTLASAWTWTFLATCLFLVFPLVLLWRLIGWPIDRMNYFGGRLYRLCAVWATAVTPRWTFSVRGQLPQDPRLPYVVVANHESFADMLLLCHLPWEMKWLSKIEIFWIPLMGWLMLASRDVGIHRGRGTSAKRAMADCRARLAARVSVMIFPEGTRSKTAEMLPFKDGAFRLAVEAGVPILPLALYGTRSAIARRDWRINPAHAVVQVLEPEPTAGVTDIAALRERVRVRIETARDRLRAELAADQRSA